MLRQLARSNLDGTDGIPDAPTLAEDMDEAYIDEDGTKVSGGKLTTALERSRLTHYFKPLEKPFEPQDAIQGVQVRATHEPKY